MSCDWNIRCVDCDEMVTHFMDANHRIDLMNALIEYRGAIVALAPLLRAWPDHVSLSTSYGFIDASDFERHCGHRLVPHDEYGRDAEELP